jgi:hypothetical protein
MRRASPQVVDLNDKLNDPGASPLEQAIGHEAIGHTKRRSAAQGRIAKRSSRGSRWSGATRTSRIRQTSADAAR